VEGLRLGALRPGNASLVLRCRVAEEIAVILRRRPSVFLAVVAAAVLAVTAAAASGPSAGKGPVRLNELQAIGTHNSFKREISEAEQAEYDEIIATPGDYDAFLAYSHASIPNQFGLQDVRGLELDLFGDPAGGLYAEPLVRKRLGLGPLPDLEWRRPGIKVLHIADFDYATTCVRFVTCLEQVESWSDANPGHVPMTIMLELKRSDSRAVANGGVVAPAWDAAALDALDAEIRSVFRERDMITPDDVRRPGLTLEQSVLRYGWPSLLESRGQVLFLLDNDPGPIRTAYTAGRPNLEGRAIFTNSRAGQPDAAFIKRNEPRDANTAQIQDLVRAGYLVRTRSDIPLATVTSGDTAMLEAALASGAHVISTDFPEVGMSARYNSDFVARMPDGGTVRCNPVSARRSCDDDRLEWHRR
jgi:Phosphoinositide phospholipase C, Ca2+-dependent